MLDAGMLGTDRNCRPGARSSFCDLHGPPPPGPRASNPTSMVRYLPAYWLPRTLSVFTKWTGNPRKKLFLHCVSRNWEIQRIDIGVLERTHQRRVFPFSAGCGNHQWIHNVNSEASVMHGRWPEFANEVFCLRHNELKNSIYERLVLNCVCCLFKLSYTSHSYKIQKSLRIIARHVSKCFNTGIKNTIEIK